LDQKSTTDGEKGWTKNQQPMVKKVGPKINNRWRKRLDQKSTTDGEKGWANLNV